jgi:hypothetical protein
MSESDGSQWGILALAGAVGVCCLGTAALVGGATVAGGSAAGVVAVRGTVGGLGGLLVTALATALPLLVIGITVRQRRRRQ